MSICRDYEVTILISFGIQLPQVPIPIYDVGFYSALGLSSEFVCDASEKNDQVIASINCLGDYGRHIGGLTRLHIAYNQSTVTEFRRSGIGQ